MKTVDLKARRELLGTQSYLELAAKLPTCDERRIRTLFTNKWRALKKEQLEEIIRHFDLESLDELFSIEKSTVWDPITKAKEYFALSELERPGEEAPKDRRALAIIQDYIYEVTEARAKRHCPESVEEVDRLLEKNCIICGLRKNIAAEVALCRLLGAEPFDDRRRNREKLRIGFARLPVPGLGQSALIVPAEEEDGRTVGGIRLNGDWLLKDIIFPPKDYVMEELKNAMNGGLVAVARRTVGLREILTVIVAGLSAVGTEAGARFLVEQPEALFPRNTGEMALTPFKVSYKKKSRSIKSEETGKILLETNYFDIAVTESGRA